MKPAFALERQSHFIYGISYIWDVVIMTMITRYIVFWLPLKQMTESILEEFIMTEMKLLKDMSLSFYVLLMLLTMMVVLFLYPSFIIHYYANTVHLFVCCSLEGNNETLTRLKEMCKIQ